MQFSSGLFDLKIRRVGERGWMRGDRLGQILHERFDLAIAENAPVRFGKRRHQGAGLAVHDPIFPKFRVRRFR